MIYTVDVGLILIAKWGGANANSVPKEERMGLNRASFIYTYCRGEEITAALNLSLKTACF